MDVDIKMFEGVLRMGLVGNDITEIIESLKRCEIIKRDRMERKEIHKAVERIVDNNSMAKNLTSEITDYIEKQSVKTVDFDALVREKIAEEMLGYCGNANNWRVEELEMEYNNNLPGVTVEFQLIKLEDVMKIIDSNFTA